MRRVTHSHTTEIPKKGPPLPPAVSRDQVPPNTSNFSRNLLFAQASLIRSHEGRPCLSFHWFDNGQLAGTLGNECNRCGQSYVSPYCNAFHQLATPVHQPLLPRPWCDVAMGGMVLRWTSALSGTLLLRPALGRSCYCLHHCKHLLQLRNLRIQQPKLLPPSVALGLRRGQIETPRWAS